MKIKGLEKVSLIDYPGKICCTIFLFGCNFMCGFCHNPELVLKDDGVRFSEQDILDFLKRRKGQLEGVCITGGEPLLTLNEEFLLEIRNMGYLIKLDTNGSNPEKLEEFLDKGLVDFVAMDIKTVPEEYPKITFSGIDVKNIEQSIKIIVNKAKDYEFRTTIVEGIHDPDKIKRLTFWIAETVGKKPKKFVLQGFKRGVKLIDPTFFMKNDTTEEYLNDLKRLVENYFERVEIRF